VDAQLGDALFFLTALFHFEMAAVSSWTDQPPDWEGMEPRHNSDYQMMTPAFGKRWILFRPAGAKGDLFSVYAARINAAGSRPQGPFPGHAFCKGLDLGYMPLRLLTFEGGRLEYSSLIKSSVHLCNFAHARFLHARLIQTEFAGCAFEEAELAGADLSKAQFKMSDLSGADLNPGQAARATLDDATTATLNRTSGGIA
jgi:hypothetical protein